ncbi:MAG: mandelate racemase/muconate lactonizing enzyme family protein [Candidatus Hodarchaeota archaeon]
MKITDIRTYTPLNASLFVRVFTDEGTSGIGECSPMNPQVTAYFIEKTLKPLLMGQDPIEIEKLWNKMFFSTYKQGVQGIQPEAISGVDIALWDILGKKTGLSVCTLLGGAFRDRVQHYASISGGGTMSIDQMVELAGRRIDEGFKAIKVKMNWYVRKQDINPKKDLEMTIQVKSTLNKDVLVCFDANNGYSVPTAIQMGRKFDEIGIYHFEEPVAQYDYNGIKKVCDAIDTPVAAGEQEYTPWQFKDLMTIADVDIIQPDVIKVGGITSWKKIGVLSEIYNKMIVTHQTQPTVGAIANVHVCSSIQSCTRPQEYMPGKIYLEDLFLDLPKLKDGYIKVPAKPGLGITVHEENFEDIEFRPG